MIYYIFEKFVEIPKFRLYCTDKYYEIHFISRTPYSNKTREKRMWKRFPFVWVCIVAYFIHPTWSFSLNRLEASLNCRTQKNPFFCKFWTYRTHFPNSIICFYVLLHTFLSIMAIMQAIYRISSFFMTLCRKVLDIRFIITKLFNFPFLIS